MPYRVNAMAQGPVDAASRRHSVLVYKTSTPGTIANSAKLCHLVLLPSNHQFDTMRFQSVLLVSAAAAGAVANTVNRTLTNGWGSTPSGRHYINHTQALAVLNAGVARSLETG